jgi:gliding motility-associated-like protein
MRVFLRKSIIEEFISFICLAIFVLPFTAKAQRQANIWHFGDSICLDFSTGVPVQQPNSSMFSFEGACSYSDAFGNLLFYSNGGGREAFTGQDEGHIWNRNHAEMYNMQGIEGGGFSAKQSSVAFEAPGQPGIYYLFTMDEMEFDIGASTAINIAQPYGRGLSYFIIDMSLNNGLGGVVTADQRVHVPSAEGLCAIKHANGSDYWILINQDSTGIGIYSVTSSGVSLSGVYNYPFIRNATGKIKASPAGDYVYAQLCLSDTSAPYHLFNFDKATGVLSNPLLLGLRNGDADFSPNGRYLYADAEVGPLQRVIRRYDLTSANIIGSAIDIFQTPDYCFDFQNGPDGKMYFLKWNTSFISVQLCRINCPNTSSPTIDTAVFTFPGYFFSLPNFPDWLFETDNDQYVSLGSDTLELCTNVSSFTLDALNPGATYLWSNGATSQSITVTSPGEYSVIVTGPCGTGIDSVVVTQCSALATCDLFSSPDTLAVCAGDTIQLQANLSGYSQVTQLQWHGGGGVFIPSDTVASPAYLPSASENAAGGLYLNLSIDGQIINSSPSGRLIAYDHESQDLIFSISTVDGSIDSLQDNSGFDWLAMGYKSSSALLYGCSAFFPGFSSINILNGDSNVINNFSNSKFYAGEFDNVNGKFFVVGNNPSAAGTPVDQFLATIDTATGAVSVIGNLNLFTTDAGYFGLDDGINGLAYEPNQNVLFGVSNNGKLFRIDVNTAATTFLGFTIGNLRGLAYDPTAGKLWGISSSATLFQLNQNTGAPLDTVFSQIPFNFVTSLTYAPDDASVDVSCTDSLFIRIYSIPNVAINTLNDSCSRFTYPFSLTTSGILNSVLWNFDDPGSGSSNVSSASDVSHTFSAPGSYDITAIVNLECLTDTLFATVNVLPVPELNLQVSQNPITAGDSALLSASGGDSYLWSPVTGLSCSTCPSTYASPVSTTTYAVTATNSAGCTATEIVNITVDIRCNEFFIPDIFSPNGSGPDANERFCAFSNCVRLYSLIIYNRWGEEVFETTDINSCWDGNKDGTEAPSGVYAYKLYAEQIDGTVIDRKGTITLVR